MALSFKACDANTTVMGPIIREYMRILENAMKLPFKLRKLYPTK